MKKIVILVIFSIFFTGCSSISSGIITGISNANRAILNSIDRLFGNEYFSSSVEFYSCSIKDDLCLENKKFPKIQSYKLIINLATDRSYAQYLYDKGDSYVGYPRITADNIDDTVENINIFIKWASLSYEEQVKTKEIYQNKIKGKTIGDTLYIDSLYGKMTPFIVIRHSSHYFLDDTLFMLNKESVLAMKKELLVLKDILKKTQ